MAGRNEIEILIRARDEASKALENVNRKIRDIEGATGVASSGMADLENHMGLAERRAMAASHGWVQMAKGMLAAQVIMEAFNLAYEGTIGLLLKGIKSIDDLRIAQASMASAAASNDPSKPFEKLYETAGRIVEKVYELDRAFIGTGDELLMLSDSMVTFGMGIDLSTKKQQDQFVAFANMIKMMTRGQDFQRQAYQEIRALMEGVDVQGALLVKKLEAAGVNVKAMVPAWREQGVLLEKIMEILPGYGQGSKEIEKTLQAQKSSLETITYKILREGTAPAYEDITKLVKQINDSLMDQNGLTQKGKILVDGLKLAWIAVSTPISAAGKAMDWLLQGTIAYYNVTKNLVLTAKDQIFGGKNVVTGKIADILQPSPEGDLKLPPGGQGIDDATIKAAESLAKKIETLYDKIAIEAARKRGGDIEAELEKARIDYINRNRNIVEMQEKGKVPAAERKEQLLVSEQAYQDEREKIITKSEQHIADAVDKIRKNVEKEELAALELQIKNIGKRAELELKGIERQEELTIRLKALRDEAETPVKWPWNENEVELMQRMNAETTKFAENIRRLNKEFDASERGEGPLMTKGQYDEAFRAYQDAYGAAMGKVREETDVTTQHVADAWNELFNGLGGEISDVFFDAFKGKLKSLGDYMETFTDIVRRAWANLISDMIMEQLKLSFGATAKAGLMSLAGMFGSSGGTPATSGVGGSVGSGVVLAAEGAIFPGSFMPIRAFASGGIADRPTFGLIGEGGGPEAVIPLKGGKVPVEMRGGSSPVNFNFNIISADTKDMDRLLMDRRGLIVGMVADGMRNASSLRDSMRRSI